MGTLRRELIRNGVTVGIVSVTGCMDSAVDSGDGGGGSQREQIIDSREEVAEDEYMYFTFDLNREATLDYDYIVRSGPDIEIFVLDDREFDEFQGGNSFRAYSQEGGASGSNSVTLAQDSYRLVVDNTNAGEIQPPTNLDDDIAAVEVTAWIEG